MDNLSQKEKLLKDFAELSKGKSNEEMLPLIIAVLNKAKQENITISKSEAKSMIDNLLSDAPEEKRKQMNMFVEILTQI